MKKPRHKHNNIKTVIRTNYGHPAPDPAPYEQDALRLEAVTTCIGFDDLLDVTLGLNHQHLDTMIVVTSHADRRTQAVAKKHGALCIQTDLFKKNGRNFNKGAAINAGFDLFQYYGWRMHIDSDIVLPDNFRRVLLNHTHLDRNCIYGADRVDVVGNGELEQLQSSLASEPQNSHRCFVQSGHHRRIGHRYVDPLRGYCPIGWLQLWHSSAHKSYPYSLGSAAHDDTIFSGLWAVEHRRHLPTVICYHLCAAPPQWGENWEGHRKQPRWSRR